MPDNYVIRELSVDEFSGFEFEWGACLERSAADPLFSSWAWCYSWWKTWAKSFHLESFVQLVYFGNDLVAIAPLYRTYPDRKFGPSGAQIQFIGNAWMIGNSVRSEHTNFIIAEGHEKAVLGLFADLLSNSAQDLLIKDHSPILREAFRGMGRRLTEREKDRGVHVDVRGDFESWVSSLGKNTRLKVYNRRNYLGERLELETLDIQDKSARQYFYKLLCEFHLQRREQEPDALELEFHELLATASPAKVKAVYSVLKVDDNPVSVVYDLIAGEKQYNLQSVFVADFDKKVSLGLLHLGYAVESAFNNPGVKVYDFLAGEGENTFYKERLKGDCGEIYDLLTSQVSISLSHAVYLSMHMSARKLLRKARGRNA